MRSTKIGGHEPGSMPFIQLYGTPTATDIYNLEVTTGGASGTAKITITSNDNADNVVATVVTHGVPFALGTCGVYVVFFFELLCLTDKWTIRTRATGELEEPRPLALNFPGTARLVQAGEGIAIQNAYKTAVAIIPINTALSQPIDCRGYTSLVVDMPAVWTPAQIGFHTSEIRQGTFSLLYDNLGDEIFLDVAAGGNYKHLNALKGVSVFKLASINIVGHSSTVQAAERKIIITMEA